MITKQDGFTYFTDSFEGDAGTEVSIEYKFKSLDDGNFEAYSKDVTNRFITNEYIRHDTRISPEGKQNVILKQFVFTLNQALAKSSSKRTKSTTGKIASMSRVSPFNLGLRNDLKQTLIESGITISPFINSAIEEKLERENLL